MTDQKTAANELLDIVAEIEDSIERIRGALADGDLQGVAQMNKLKADAAALAAHGLVASPFKSAYVPRWQWLFADSRRG
jgi:hypothetical protein